MDMETRERCVVEVLVAQEKAAIQEVTAQSLQWTMATVADELREEGLTVAWSMATATVEAAKDKSAQQLASPMIRPKERPMG